MQDGLLETPAGGSKAKAESRGKDGKGKKDEKGKDAKVESYMKVILILKYM